MKSISRSRSKLGIVILLALLDCSGKTYYFSSSSGGWRWSLARFHHKATHTNKILHLWWIGPRLRSMEQFYRSNVFLNQKNSTFLRNKIFVAVKRSSFFRGNTNQNVWCNRYLANIGFTAHVCCFQVEDDVCFSHHCSRFLKWFFVVVVNSLRENFRLRQNKKIALGPQSKLTCTAQIIQLETLL